MTDNGSNAGLLSRILSRIEQAGNRLPHPAILFAALSGILILVSGLVSVFELSVTLPGSDTETLVRSLLSLEGLHFILTHMVSNFVGFAPLGTVLVALLGIGIAESSGLMSAGLRLLVLSAPRRLLTFAIVFAGILSNTASEVGYVVLLPLGAMIFLAVGRHPIAGLAAAFAGVSGGYSANLLLGTIDPLLAGLTEASARILIPTYEVNPAANYFFMAASVFFIAGAGTWVTEAVIVPRLGPYRGAAEPERVEALSPAERRGLRFAGRLGLLLVLLLVWSAVPIEDGIFAYLPGTGFLRDPETQVLLRSPFMSGIVALIFIMAGLLGITYGIGARTIKSGDDVIQGMGKSMSTLGTYIVLVFFAAQFVAYFNWTNLGLVMAVKGAELLQALGLTAIPLTIMFVLVSAFINLIMGSASAKWALMAPVFVPMFMLLGYAPEFTQVVYRVGDSVTNIISPLMAYFALIVAFMQKYEPRAGIGTIVATMLPYTVVFLVVWLVLLIAWILLGIPVGPGADVLLDPEVMEALRP
jgi:aminobenzoyl-glutamate transport protein